MAVDPENPQEVSLDCDGQHPMIMPGHTLASVTEKISDVTFLPVNKMPKQWWIGFTIAFCLMQADAHLAILNGIFSLVLAIIARPDFASLIAQTRQQLPR